MLSFAFSLLMTFSAFAKNDCMKVMTNEVGSQFEEVPDPKTLDQAEQWLLRLGDMDSSLEKGLSAYRSWQRWNSVTSEQRSHVLALELKLISPDAIRPNETGQLVNLDGRARLKQLSARNLKRMLLQLRIKHPEADDVDLNSKFGKQAENISRTFKIVYAIPMLFSPPQSLTERAATPPLASPREMLRSGIFPQTTEYYSQLLSGAPSTGVNVRLVSGNQRAPAGLYLNREIAQQDGFMMPEFQIPEELISFFGAWDIEALDQLLRENQMSFPSSVSSGRKMLEYFKHSGVYPDQVFTPDRPEKMRALKEKLNEYVLTEEDGLTLLRESFRLYVLHLAEKRPADYTRITGELFVKLTPKTLNDFFNFLEWPNITLRVPVAVRETDYTLVRQRPPSQSFKGPLYGSPGFAGFEQRLQHDAGRPSSPN